MTMPNLSPETRAEWRRDAEGKGPITRIAWLTAQLTEAQAACAAMREALTALDCAEDPEEWSIQEQVQAALASPHGRPLLDELTRLRAYVADGDNALSWLATLTDRLNSWCREAGVEPALDEKGARDALDRIWAKVSGELARLRGQPESRDLDEWYAEETARLNKVILTHADALRLAGEALEDVPLTDDDLGRWWPCCGARASGRGVPAHDPECKAQRALSHPAMIAARRGDG